MGGRAYPISLSPCFVCSNCFFLLVWGIQVQEQLRDRIKRLEGDAAKAKSDGKSKKLAKLEEGIEAIKAKLDSLSELKPMVYKVRHEKRIKEIRRSLNEIKKLEGSKQLMDVASVKKIGQKDGLQEELDDLMEDNLGWFETSASIEEMMPKVRSFVTPRLRRCILADLPLSLSLSRILGRRRPRGEAPAGSQRKPTREVGPPKLRKRAPNRRGPPPNRLQRRTPSTSSLPDAFRCAACVINASLCFLLSTPLARSRGVKKQSDNKKASLY